MNKVTPIQARSLPTMCDHRGDIKVGEEILPPVDTKRWTAGRKMDILTALNKGVIDLAGLKKKYNLSVDEILEWAEGFGKRGLIGLSVTKIRTVETTSVG